MIPRQDSLKWPIRGNVGLRPQTGTFDRFSALPDPGLKIRGGGGGEEDGLQRIFFGPLGLTLVYKKEGGGPPPPPPPALLLDPPLFGHTKVQRFH